MSVVEQWVEKARYDLDTARAMQDTGRYQYVLFCCQQALEKAIKAIIVKKTSEMPPRIHNLMRLVEIAELMPSDAEIELMRDLSNYYFHSQYPEEISARENSVTSAKSSELLNQTEKYVKWLLSTL